MYESFYKLNHSPFQLAPDPSYFFNSGTHRYGLVKLRQSLSCDDNVVLVTGTPGLGKTELMLNFVGELDPAKYLVARITLSNLEANNILHFVADALGLDQPGNHTLDLIEEIESFLAVQARENKKVLLVLDDVHFLTAESLAELSHLCALNDNGASLLHCYFFGEESIIEKMAHLESQDLMELDTYIELGPIKASEIQDYIEHRLLQAGWQGNPHFSTIACELIHEYSQGIPRQINLLCNRALVQGCLDETHEIDENLVRIFETNSQVDNIQMPSYGSSAKVVGLPDVYGARSIKQNSVGAIVMKDEQQKSGKSQEFIDTVELDRPLVEEDESLSMNAVETAFEDIYGAIDDEKDGAENRTQRHTKGKFNRIIEKAAKVKKAKEEKNRSKNLRKDEGDELKEKGLLDDGLRAMTTMYSPEKHTYVPPVRVSPAQSRQSEINASKSIENDSSNTVRYSANADSDVVHPDRSAHQDTGSDQTEKYEKKVIIDDSLYAADEHDEHQLSELNAEPLDDRTKPAPNQFPMEFSEQESLSSHAQYNGREECDEQPMEIEESYDSVHDQQSAPYDESLVSASHTTELSTNNSPTNEKPARIVIDDYELGYSAQRYSDDSNHATGGYGGGGYKRNNRSLQIAVGASIVTSLMITLVIWLLSDPDTDKELMVVSGGGDQAISSEAKDSNNPFVAEVKDPFGSGASNSGANNLGANNAGDYEFEADANQSVTLAQASADSAVQFGAQQFAQNPESVDNNTTNLSNVEGADLSTVDNVLSDILEKGSDNQPVVVTPMVVDGVVAGNASAAESQQNLAEAITVLVPGKPKTRSITISKSAKASGSRTAKSKNKKVASTKKSSSSKKLAKAKRKSTSKTTKKSNVAKAKKPKTRSAALIEQVGSKSNMKSGVASNQKAIQFADLKQLLSQFSSAYETGNIKQMRAILSSDVKSNDAHNRKQVEKDFRKLFDVTDLRKIKISEINWLAKENKMQGRANFLIQIREKGDSRVSSYKGLIKLDVIQGSKGVVIKRLDYQYL